MMKSRNQLDVNYYAISREPLINVFGHFAGWFVLLWKWITKTCFFVGQKGFDLKKYFIDEAISQLSIF